VVLAQAEYLLQGWGVKSKTGQMFGKKLRLVQEVPSKIIPALKPVSAMEYKMWTLNFSIPSIFVGVKEMKTGTKSGEHP
jgi:hypothetical protein